MALPQPDTIRGQLDEIAQRVGHMVSVGESYRSNLPDELADAVDRWKFGQYGYDSPTNILLTSAWVKALDPDQNIHICFITKEGGYNGRDMDEKYTVPLVAKYGIYEQFCSRNSGFQGSRKIENQKRSGVLSRNDFNGSVRWDKSTFFDIMEGINSDSTLARKAFHYLIEKGFIAKNRIEAERQQLLNEDSGCRDKFSAFKLLTKESIAIRDPQFHKALVAAFMQELYEGQGFLVGGLGGARTGADARDQSPGDLWSELAGNVVEGVEVKDMTHTFDWRHIAAASDRIRHHPNIALYTLVTTGNKAVSDEIANDEWLAHCEKKQDELGTRIRAVTYAELLEQNWYLDFAKIVHRVTRLLANGEIPDIKSGTLQQWKTLIQ
ncbi:MAG: hypothetical protein ACPGTU_07185 [Myxococcota bacterium]